MCHPLERNDFFFETTNHQTLAELDQVDRHVLFGMLADLHDFARVADTDQQTFFRRVGKRPSL